MNIDYSYYTLESKNEESSSTIAPQHKGALLKIKFEDDLIGYADCHPWPEMGDKPVEDQLAELRQRRTTALMRCSLRFARLDAEARNRSQCLLDHKAVPSSHFLITDLLAWTPQAVEQLIQQGYTHVKIKLGKHLGQEIAHLLQLFCASPLKLRLDFNEKLSADEFRAFLRAIEKIKSSIEFIEDPTVFQPLQWKEFQENYEIALACDRQAAAALHWPESAQFLIVKPAIESIDVFEKALREKVIITSYLDHPLGQLAAAYIAAQTDPQRLKVHGLLSHYTYLPNIFSQGLAQQGPHFITPSGVGFGYDEQLSQVDWKAL
jgi:O-succinylbenzoate synthase